MLISNNPCEAGEDCVVQEINLYDLLKYYARNWLIILSALFVGAAIGLIYTNFIQTALYKSDATMLVVGARTSQDATINNNYTELFKSRRVLETVIDNQGYKGDYDQLLARTTATNDKNTDIIKVSIADPDPKKSEQLLSASLEVFKKEASTLYDSNNIKTVDPASLPSSSYNVNLLLQVGLSMAATALLVIIALFFVYDYRMSNPAPAQAAKPKKAAKATTTKSTSKTTKKPAKKASVTAKKSANSTQRTSVLRRFGSLLTGTVVPPQQTPATKKTK